MRALLLPWLVLIPTLAHAQSLPAQPSSITVSGEASAKLAPDAVTLPVTVYTENKELNAAKTENDRKLAAVLSLAKELGIPKEKLQTQMTQLSPLYDYAPDTGKQTLHGYQASATIAMTLEDLSKLTPLMDKLAQAGIDRIGSAQFGLKDEKKARDALLVKAMQDARSKADVLAGAAGVKAGKPITIQEHGGGIGLPRPPVPMMARAEMASLKMDAAAPDLPGGEMEIRQTVSVSFALE